jgi:hypothetical protein
MEGCKQSNCTKRQAIHGMHKFSVFETRIEYMLKVKKMEGWHFLSKKLIRQVGMIPFARESYHEVLRKLQIDTPSVTIYTGVLQFSCNFIIARMIRHNSID